MANMAAKFDGTMRVGTGRIYARLIPVKDGTLVIIADDSRRAPHRKLHSEVLPYQLNVVVEHAGKLLKEFNDAAKQKGHGDHKKSPVLQNGPSSGDNRG